MTLRLLQVPFASFEISAKNWILVLLLQKEAGAYTTEFEWDLNTKDVDDSQRISGVLFSPKCLPVDTVNFPPLSSLLLTSILNQEPFFFFLMSSATTPRAIISGLRDKGKRKVQLLYEKHYCNSFIIFSL